MEKFEAFIGVNFWTALLTLINFLLVLYVGKKFLYGPIMKIIHDRQKEIEDMYADAGSAKQQAQAMQAEYQQKLNTAKESSEQIIKEATARGHSREEQIIAEANASANAIREKAAQDIAREKKQAINDAKDEISGISMAIAEKVVERQLNEQDQQKLVEQFIDRLGEGL